MNFPQIRLQSQMAQIEMTTNPAKQSIEQPGPDLDLQQPPAELHIDRTPSVLSIDQSEARADVDLKSIRRRVEEFAQNGYQEWLNGIARRAQEGNELMRIENGGNPIASIGKQNGKLLPTYEFNIGYVPKAGSVKIDFQPTKLDIQWDIKKPINNTKARKPIIDYQPGTVDIRIKQYQDLQIDFDNLKYVGINYEQEI
ncbi:DUF6470 family protein [Heyndrickxia oleronia]|uniref:DUF6470 family protein n=1 Tax=Heyndrickxia oleronia TaxID=38875 RepID=UPI00242EC43D|nr:DUF6470 family protein [Heyndrickxia oleronia]MCI1592500.1 DUF6470 family protein [Heyndrickxia oleronia]MCI1615398.1 DUF6470 family protein [Heyndrickxia oleronia]MCI1746204.1 DUF6470 family protein [Heyndrickxia oleronia]MCI1763688.1 DUF6470 family protein [Heyndrickxia oleronia]